MTLNEFLFRDNALTILPSTWHLISSHPDPGEQHRITHVLRCWNTYTDAPERKKGATSKTWPRVSVLKWKIC